MGPEATSWPSTSSVNSYACLTSSRPAAPLFSFERFTNLHRQNNSALVSHAAVEEQAWHCLQV